MDATTNDITADEARRILAAPVTRGPRKRTDYRAARRNAAKAARMLPEWRESVADAANERANLSGRAIMANGAREAAAKAVVELTHTTGLPRHVIAASAMLSFYVQQKWTRAISRQAVFILTNERDEARAARGAQ